MATNINTLKSWFKTGLKPTQAQFWAWMDSYWHKDEKISQTSISGLEDSLNNKAEKSQLDAHKTDANAHADLFLSKEDKDKKGIAGGYAPLDEFNKLATQYLDIINDLFTGGATSILSAEQGVVLQGQIDGINTLLASDNINLDTVQEIVDAIENVQSYLSTILVNDLVTGGVTKALTAEMGKILENTKLTATIATDAETQIVAPVAEDNKVVSRSKLYNWWENIKSKAQTVSGVWNFTTSLKFGTSGYFTSDSTRMYMRAYTGKTLQIGVEGVPKDSIALDGFSVMLNHKLNLPVGTATNAPLVLPSGTLTTVSVNGSLEADSTAIYYTVGGVRKNLLDRGVVYTGAPTNYIWGSGVIGDAEFLAPIVTNSTLFNNGANQTDTYSIISNTIISRWDSIISKIKIELQINISNSALPDTWYTVSVFEGNKADMVGTVPLYVPLACDVSVQVAYAKYLYFSGSSSNFTSSNIMLTRTSNLAVDNDNPTKQAMKVSFRFKTTLTTTTADTSQIFLGNTPLFQMTRK